MFLDKKAKLKILFNPWLNLTIFRITRPTTKIHISSFFQFVDVESAITSIVDRFAHKLRRGHRKELFSLITCCLMFLAGLSMVTEVCNFSSK